MNKEELEKIIIDKLDKGLLDGVVGNDFQTGDYSKVTIRKIIVDGVPQVLRLGASSKFFNNRENVKLAGKRTVELFETVTQKLDFIKKYGWLINDEDVKEYSSLFKPRK